MKKTTGIKLVSGISGVAALLSGCAANAPEGNVALPIDTEEAAAPAVQQESPVVIEAREQEDYMKIAHVSGEFSFDQEVLSPTDDVFNIFGTVATAMCAKPGFAFNEVELENYFVNVKGNIKKTYSLSLAEIQKMQQTTKTTACSCATSSAVVNTRPTGVKVEDVIQLADLEPGVNTITIRGDDGYGLPLPLNYVLEKEAMLVWSLDGMDLSASQGGPLALWIPETVAKYFTRQVMEIELTAEDNLPEIIGPDAEQRAKVNIVNRMKGTEFALGEQITFEGYADDIGSPICAVEFSLDGGETWTAHETAGATADRWVYWRFSYVADTAGTFKLDVRARTEDGTVSPLAASVVFTVSENPSDSF
ncbi:MAG: molybdopterin-dependent oxidoreductase [Christensenellales bacterium]|jgi:DMSO/TMAO reductase YedYZ molybdopterin-dependent catalytic subunit